MDKEVSKKHYTRNKERNVMFTIF